MNFLYVMLIIFLIIGLIKPHAGLFWYQRQRTRGVAVLVYGGLLLFLAFTTPPEKRDSDPVLSQVSVSDTNNFSTDSAEPTETKLSDDPATTAAKEVRRKLRAKAEQNWPNDYSTQEYWINQEMDDYEIMLSIPDNAVKRQAQRDWPYDFSTQKYWYQQQLAAKERLNDE